MTPVFLALGGNLGQVEESFQLALDQLAALPLTHVVAMSSVHRSAAVGENAGGEFRNAAARIDTSLEPLDLLTRLQQIEDGFGRVRETRWGPRPLDLDIIFFGNRVISHPRLYVPHPACWYRRFVLDPLSEIAGDWLHPEKGLSVGRLRERLLARPLPVELAGIDTSEGQSLAREIGHEFADVAVDVREMSYRAEPATRHEPVITFWFGERGANFDALPVVSRLEVSPIDAGRSVFVRDVLRAALAR